MRPEYPFSAIVGQEEMKLSLLLNVIEPRIGGVLIRGEKGTAKSTAVRALASLLPPLTVVRGDPCQQEPGAGDDPADVTSVPMRVVTLPLGATEDRVVGTLDIEAAIRTGERRFEPGVLAAANRNILYVDEVNLLEDHIVDLLLDAAAAGVNRVEREGISWEHPSRFVLVGTMNPEEGEIRPQLLDRFGLAVEISAMTDPADRVEVVERRLAFDADPEAFVAEWETETVALRDRLERASQLVPRVRAGRGVKLMIASLAIGAGVDGHRADLTLHRAASALAAWNDRSVPTEEDVLTVAPLVFAHRLRRQPFDEGRRPEDWLAKAVEAARQLT